MGKLNGCRIQIDDILNLPSCIECNKEAKFGESFMLIDSKLGKRIMCIDCYNHAVLEEQF